MVFDYTAAQSSVCVGGGGGGGGIPQGEFEYLGRTILMHYEWHKYFGFQRTCRQLHYSY